MSSILEISRVFGVKGGFPLGFLGEGKGGFERSLESFLFDVFGLFYA